MKYVGVDGCPAGWCAVIKEENDWHTAVYTDIAELWSKHKDAALILIDMPIGVLDDGTDRPCDYKVRKLIGKRRSSLFPMPCRAALYASSYEEASLTNFKITGKKLSREMWNIMPKMRQLNDFLVNNTEALAVIKETHPELCFTGLSAGRPMEYAKKKEKDPAFEERLRVLISYCSGANALIEKALKEYQRRYVARDDIVDAMALAIMASFGIDKLQSIPEKPEFDAKGLPMQMLYYLKKD
jgi:predicted RNase H-like nuclease